VPNQEQQPYGSNEVSNAQQFFSERAQERRDQQGMINPFSAAVSGLIGAALAKKMFGNRGS
jgi:hypothetical protein